MKAEEILNTYTPNREYNSYYHESFIIEAMQEYARIQIEKDRKRITEAYYDENGKFSDFKNMINETSIILD